MSEKQPFEPSPVSDGTLQMIVSGKTNAYQFEARSMAKELLELRKKLNSQQSAQQAMWDIGIPFP